MDGDDFATLVWQIEGFSSQSREKKNTLFYQELEIKYSET